MSKIDKAIAKLIEFRGQQRISEFKEVLKLIEERGVKTILEIGAYEGGTTAAFLEMGCKIVSIDLEHKSNLDHENLIKITGDSHSENVKLELNEIIDSLDFGTFDLLFIDGDHTEIGVGKDFEEYMSFIKYDGIVCFHDINDSKFHAKHGCYVSNYWKALASNFKHTRTVIEICNTDNIWANKDFEKMEGIEGAGGIGIIIFNN